jgi:hypothetical protein
MDRSPSRIALVVALAVFGVSVLYGVVVLGGAVMEELASIPSEPDWGEVARQRREDAKHCDVPPSALADLLYEGLRWGEIIHVSSHDQDVVATGLADVAAAPIGDSQQSWVVVAKMFTSERITVSRNWIKGVWRVDGSLGAPTAVSSLTDDTVAFTSFPRGLWGGGDPGAAYQWASWCHTTQHWNSYSQGRPRTDGP